MSIKAKTIKMLLYDGSMNGVMNISNSAWESGKMYSAPRESINDLVSKADCKRYGVYLLLSDRQVYVGQASDLERRTKQHLTDKDWWTQVIIMTTKDDSFNASDIDYLEARLISLAEDAGTLDSENKKKGNPQKVDEFRQAELEQYLDEALFLLDIISLHVFKKKKKTKNTLDASQTPTRNQLTIQSSISKPLLLPDENLKIGEYVYEAMRRLSESGFIFTTQQIDEMTTPIWSWEHFHTRKPFMKRYKQGITDNKGTDGYVRFKSQPYMFGNEQVLISKEWYENQRNYFIEWFSSLR